MRARAFTVLEVLVSVGIVSLIGVLIYGAFHGMSRSRRNMEQVNERHQQGRAAVARMARELASAFISGHVPFQPLAYQRQTAFVGRDERPADRVDFTAFANRRLGRDSHESDQAELSYFAARDRDTGNLDLVRRLGKHIDDHPERGGVVEVLAENIESFDVRYLDPVSNEWLETWDSTQPAAQLGRLPAQVWLVLVLRQGVGERPVRLETKVPIAIQFPLTFATGL
jgi:general secretion pathway protein J